MSGLNDLRTRIKYYGGGSQQDRMIQDKLNSLQRAIKYSYQGATISIDGSKKLVRCLINPRKINIDEDIKVLSVPYQDKNRYGEIEDTKIHIGAVIEWIETSSYWLVYNKNDEEYAYFRGELRRCNQEMEIDGKKYRVYFRGPDEKKIDWKKEGHTQFNTLNYIAQIFLPNTEELKELFHRFTIIKIAGEPWEVQAVDALTNPGLLQVNLKEWYKNSIAEAAAEEESKKPQPPEPSPGEPHIVGEKVIYPYQQYSYSIVGYDSGTWSIDNQKKVTILSSTATTVEIGVITGRSGEVNLTFTPELEQSITLKLTIGSL